MNAQMLIVAPVVLACAAQAGWTLLPARARRALAACLLRWPLPARVARPLRRAQERSGGCHCDGCDAGTRPSAGGAQPIRIERRHPEKPGG